MTTTIFCPFSIKRKSRQTDSNRRPADYKSDLQINLKLLIHSRLVCSVNSICVTLVFLALSPHAAFIHSLHRPNASSSFLINFVHYLRPSYSITTSLPLAPLYLPRIYSKPWFLGCL